MKLGDKVTKLADNASKITDEFIAKRQSTKGDEKTKYRRAAKYMESALKNIKRAENEFKV